MTLAIKKSYYGWWIVFGAIICQFLSMSVSQTVVGVFMKPVTEDLGWQVWQFTLGSSLAVGVGALSGIIVGKIVDQKGPRILIIVGATVSAICLYGTASESGTLPGMAMSRSPRLFLSGCDASNILVYGCCGSAKSRFRDDDSTILPA